jgi:hypothetical protein
MSFIDTSDGSQYEVAAVVKAGSSEHLKVGLTIGQVDHEGTHVGEAGNWVTTFLELTPKESKALRAALQAAEGESPCHWCRWS